jgi:uncharacterized membrane protein
MPDVTDTFAKHQAEHEHLHGAFGSDRFGAVAERVARFFGTPNYILGQTMAVVAWIAVNGAAVAFRWDPYPFILLNLAFSTQAAYAAPLILLAQTRQAERDKAHEEAAARHREELADVQNRMLDENTRLTRHVEALSREIDSLTKMIHDRVASVGGG